MKKIIILLFVMLLFSCEMPYFDFIVNTRVWQFYDDIGSEWEPVLFEVKIINAGKAALDKIHIITSVHTVDFNIYSDDRYVYNLQVNETGVVNYSIDTLGSQYEYYYITVETE